MDNLKLVLSSLVGNQSFFSHKPYNAWNLTVRLPKTRIVAVWIEFDYIWIHHFV